MMNTEDLTSYLMIQRRWEIDEEAIENLTAPTWVRQDVPWMPPRGTSLESVRAFSRRHRLELRPSEMLDPPNPDVLGVFVRRTFRRHGEEDNLLFKELAITGIRPHEKCILGSRDNLLEYFIRRLVGSQLTHGVFRDRVAILHSRNVPVQISGPQEFPPPSEISLDIPEEPAHLGNIVKIRNIRPHGLKHPNFMFSSFLTPGQIRGELQRHRCI